MMSSRVSSSGRPRTAVVLLVVCLILGSALPLQAARPADPVPPAVHDVRLSQVYGGGGNSGAPLQSDFIELFNRGSAAVDLNGWSVQYASPSGATWQVTELMTVTIAAGSYLLIKERSGTQGSNAGTPLEFPDVVGNIPLASSSGKVALVGDVTPLSGNCPAGPPVIDFVGYGSADCFEGSAAAPALANDLAGLRADGGCSDGDDNALDFSATAPDPRNSSSAANSCTPAAVQLADFYALPAGSQIDVVWQTVSELGNVGFYLWRGLTAAPPDHRLNEALIPSRAPDSSNGFGYTWPDTADLLPGTTYYYWLDDLDTGRSSTRHGPVSATYQAPNAVRLAVLNQSPVAVPAPWSLAGAALILSGFLAWRRRLRTRRGRG